MNSTPEHRPEAADVAANLVPTEGSDDTASSADAKTNDAVEATEEAVAEEAVAEEVSPEAPVAEAVVEVEVEMAAATDEAPESVSVEAAAAMTAKADVSDAPKKGRRMKVKLIQIGDDSCFVDYGGRSEGSIPTPEMKNSDGEIEHEIGAEFEAVVKSSKDDEVIFSLGRKPMPKNLKELEKAFKDQSAVDGTVKSTNKGGFEVTVKGARAFCPFSQIELGYCEKPEEYKGQTLPFQIITFERAGRNIVVSRRKLLSAAGKVAAVETRKSLEVGAELDGVVRRLQAYGAFVDIGGIDGLVHVSEIRHGHVGDPKQVLKVGEKVKVKVLKLEELGTKKERISLSMKDLQPDPWSGIAEQLPAGSTTKGKVVRLTEFGAFVELFPGIDGLVHISQIAEDRIEHPSDVLKVGQEIEARVIEVDLDSQRVSLSLRPEGSTPPPRQGGGGGGGGGRRPRRDDGPTEYTSHSEEPKQANVDVSGLDFDDALELLKQKFGDKG